MRKKAGVGGKGKPKKQHCNLPLKEKEGRKQSERRKGAKKEGVGRNCLIEEGARGKVKKRTKGQVEGERTLL